MIRFDWNGLAVGDRVTVSRHVRTNAHSAVGTVAFVQKRRQANDVGIRIDEAPDRVLWPTRQEVEVAAPDRSRTAQLTERGSTEARTDV